MAFHKHDNPQESEFGTPFLFIIISRQSRWTVLHEGGATSETEPRWECIALPGDLVGFGRTKEDALDHLDQVLDATVSRAASAKAWWDANLQTLSESKERLELLKGAWTKVVTEARLRRTKRNHFLFGALAEREAPDLLQAAGAH